MGETENWIMVVLLPLLICVIGLVVYAVSQNPKVAELGRIAYFTGLLAFLLQGATQIVSVLR
jgi:Na+/phosphate symporter